MDEQSLQGYLESPNQNPSAQARVSILKFSSLRIIQNISIILIMSSFENELRLSLSLACNNVLVLLNLSKQHLQEYIHATKCLYRPCVKGRAIARVPARAPGC